MKLKLASICVATFLSMQPAPHSYSNDNQSLVHCQTAYKEIVAQNYSRIASPELLQIHRFTQNPSYNIPITDGYINIYSNIDINIIVEDNELILSRIQRGYSTFISLERLNSYNQGFDVDILREQGYKFLYVSPIIDRVHNYTSGFLLTGYKKPIPSDYHLYTSYEVLNLRLSQQLTQCRRIENVRQRTK